MPARMPTHLIHGNSDKPAPSSGLTCCSRIEPEANRHPRFSQAVLGIHSCRVTGMETGRNCRRPGSGAGCGHPECGKDGFGILEFEQHGLGTAGSGVKLQNGLEMLHSRPAARRVPSSGMADSACAGRTGAKWTPVAGGNGGRQDRCALSPASPPICRFRSAVCPGAEFWRPSLSDRGAVGFVSCTDTDSRAGSGDCGLPFSSALRWPQAAGVGPSPVRVWPDGPPAGCTAAPAWQTG